MKAVIKEVLGISLGWLLALILINYLGVHLVGNPVRVCYSEEKVCCYIYGPRLSCTKLEQLPERAPDVR